MISLIFTLVAPIVVLFGVVFTIYVFFKSSPQRSKGQKYYNTVKQEYLKLYVDNSYTFIICPMGNWIIGSFVFSVEN